MAKTSVENPRNLSGLKKLLIPAVLILGTVFYCYVLMFHYAWLQSIPGWFFFYKDRFDTQYRYLFLVFMCAFAVLAIYLSFRVKNHLFLLFLSLALFYVLQTGYGFVQGNGFESIRVKFAKAEVSDQLSDVCAAREGLLESIRNYDALYTENFWLGTKPPGLMSFYMLTRDAVGVFRPNVLVDPQACFITLTKNFAYFLPLFAALALIPLYFIFRQISTEPFAVLPGMIFISAPSVILMTLLTDQYLFPLLFTIFLFVLALAVTKRSPLYAFGAGVLAYFLVFVSFSLLPVFGLALIWPLVDYGLHRDNADWKKTLSLLVAFAAGVVLTGLLVWLFLGYNPITRYQIAFQHHRQIKQFDFSLLSIFSYLFLNQIDFMLWTGFGILFLFYLSSIKAFINIFRQKVTTYDGFRIAFFLTFLLLNLVGQTKSEVGRLWVFLLPGIALSIYPETLTLLKKPFASFLLFFSVQMLSTFMVFYYIHFP